MNKILFALLLSTLLLSINSLEAQDPFKITDTKLKKLGKTPEIKSIIDRDKASMFNKVTRKLNKKRPDNFKGRKYRNIQFPEREHQGNDPIRQREMGNRKNDPILNFDGLFSEFGSPHDPTGDLGLNHYVQAINGTQVGVFDLDGNEIAKFSSDVLWEEFGRSGAGDPIVLYDELENKWMITEFDDPALVLIAISNTSDPLGSYTAYEFATPSFPDYPKYAIWPNAIVFTTNEDGPGVLHNYFIQKDSLYAGADDVIMQRIEIDGSENTEAGFFVSTPVDFSGKDMPLDARPMIMRLNDSSWGEADQDQLELYLFDINWQNVDSTDIEQISLVTTPYDGYPCSDLGFGFDCVPQKDGTGLDAIPEVIMNVPMFRNFGAHESIVLSFITDVTNGENQSGIRWIELRRTNDETWNIYQEGTYAPDGLDRYMSSIAIDKNGNIGMGYNISSEDTYVGIRYTGRFASDPLGQMTVEETSVIDGSSGIISGGRFGDYAQMALDPTDELTFWYTSEYASTGNNSKTRIVAFQLQKNQIDTRPSKINNPTTGHNLSSSEIINVDIQNAGIESISNIKVDLYVGNQFKESVTVTDTLDENESKNIIFSNTYDFSAFGQYEITVITTIADDFNRKNDTLSSTILNYATVDGKLSEAIAASFCTLPHNLEFTFENVGLERLNSSSFEVSIEGTIIDTVELSLNLLSEEKTQLTIPIVALNNGENVVEIRLLKSNDKIEQNTTDNIISTVLNYTEDALNYSVNIQTDEYPDETTWFLTTGDFNVDVVAFGGPYTIAGDLVTANVCLEKETCYNFTIFDGLGDGICCDYGDGFIYISDQNGNEILENDGNFGDSFSDEFCTDSGCSLDANIQITPCSSATSNDGVILINVTGGSSPYLFSIDGGVTFRDTFVFTNLITGIYNIVVLADDGNCVYNSTVTLGFQSSTSDLANSPIIKVSPNPGHGFYQLEISNQNTNEYHISASILDAQGKRIQQFMVQRYGSSFHSDFSLLSYPKGIYFLTIASSKGTQMVKIVNQ
jgi:hypothetical protein